MKDRYMGLIRFVCNRCGRVAASDEDEQKAFRKAVDEATYEGWTWLGNGRPDAGLFCPPCARKEGYAHD